ncbi:Na-translocating system protein MpsC family protein [Cytobacillus gottheilii]|uniref:Na-translocating system protein MpsC family protein n=1 Tax=Cytobacillus gottheilii TaxID=859144 RepID=UPI0009BBC6CB|nr:Na-translocating system protein MpsC family protein [Cytobacillus gottheilii]
MDHTKAEYISSYISKLLRKNFGRGPKSCRTTVGTKHLVTYITGFINPMEEILIQQGQGKYVDDARASIINHLLDEIRGLVKITLNVEVAECYHDWNFPNNSGVLIFVLDEYEGDGFQTDIDIKSLEQEVGRISAIVQKVPDQVRTYPLSKTICLVERIGILIPIEKALISQGFQKELRYTKDELEKSYFHRSGKFESIFKTHVKDIMIDWNFKEDKSLMIFVLAQSN